MSDTTDTVRPPQVATTGSPREESLERSFDRIVEEGRPRLQRKAVDLVATGTVAGLEVGFGVLALLVTQDETGSHLLAGLAFSVGFIALRLGQSELFTEGFLVPVTVVAAGDARVRDLIRLWVGTLAGNLLGGWVLVWLVSQAYPELQATAVQSAGYYIDAGINLRSFSLAVLGGGAITVLTRMHSGTDEEGPKLVASVAIAFLLAGTRLFHSVLDSLLAFAALDTGHASFGYADWAGWFAWAVAGNVTGGLVLTSALRLIRSRGRVIDHRIANDKRVPAAAHPERHHSSEAAGSPQSGSPQPVEVPGDRIVEHDGSDGD